MKSMLFAIWLQSSSANDYNAMNEAAMELEAHYFIPTLFLIMVIAAVAAVLITHQKHRR